MKSRLQRYVRLSLVWIAACSLTLDSASACRLLAGRRCCCCCYVPATCECDLPAGVPGEKQSPEVQTPQTAEFAPSAVEAAPPQSLLPELPQPPGPQPAAELSGPQPKPAAPPTPSPALIAPRQPATADAPPPTNLLVPRSGLTLTPAPAQPLPRDLRIVPQPGNAAAAPRSGAGDRIAPPIPQATPPASAATTIPPPAAAAAPANPPPRTGEPSASPSIAAAADDPFGPAPSRPAERAAPAPPVIDDDPFAPSRPATAAPAATDDDDPFAPIKPKQDLPSKKLRVNAPPIKKTNAPLADPLELAGDGRLPVRQWTDSSGTFRVQARLILILDGKVRLLKETGRTTTVPLDRLSFADRQYIEQVISRYGPDLTKLDQVAAR